VTGPDGLFQGMFNKNILTFYPVWAQDKETLKVFQGVRDMQRTLKARGLKMAPEADEASTGPPAACSPTPTATRCCLTSMCPAQSAENSRQRSPLR
jgi:hypothetical protein